MNGRQSGCRRVSRCGPSHELHIASRSDGTTIASSTALPAGKVRVTIDFVYEGGPKEFGKPATVTMSVNGAKVAEGKLTRTIPAQISITEGLDIGQDVGSAIDFTYKLPFVFTGKIDKVTAELK